MGAQGAVNILYRRELAKSSDPDALRADLIADYEHTLANPYIAAERGYIDAVIRPSETRAADHPRAASAAHQARRAAAQEAREHPAVTPDPVDAAPDAAAERPVLRVVRGTPDAVELAALVAVVTAAAAGDDPTPRPAALGLGRPSRTRPRAAAQRRLARVVRPSLRPMTDPAVPAPVRVVLASASPARLALLRAAGVEPVVRVSGVDEDALEAELAALGPHRPDRRRARRWPRPRRAPWPTRSARPVSGPTLVVIGGDSVLDLDGVALGKPADAADAVRRWHDDARSRGPCCAPVTRWCGVGHEQRPRPRRESPWRRHASSFADLDDATIEAYVATGEPLRVAGAFTLDGLGGPFVEAHRRRPVERGRASPSPWCAVCWRRSGSRGPRCGRPAESHAVDDAGAEQPLRAEDHEGDEHEEDDRLRPRLARARRAARR